MFPCAITTKYDDKKDEIISISRYSWEASRELASEETDTAAVDCSRNLEKENTTRSRIGITAAADPSSSAANPLEGNKSN
uniref:Uncharacterized protein n=1 Tax=Trichogramma kaykai TaxID=54128 RepID=A0ABD2WSZ4_9HYME